jgi:Pyruvate/2-oxoacid:ferredoxin oxidoreductase delta subunit
MRFISQVVQTESASLLYCHCAFGDLVPEAKRRHLMEALSASGRSFKAVDDLCRLVATGDRDLQEWMGQQELTVVACYPRAVRGLLMAAGIRLDGRTLNVFNLREQTIEEILAALPPPGVVGERLTVEPPQRQGSWTPWFPVIDRDRCHNCKQCLSFCLFGVYELSAEGVVEVRQPQSCKANCPACARICPEVAIQFPKLNEAPLNGAAILDEQLERTKVKVNLDQMLGSDVYTALAERRKKARHRRLLAVSPAETPPQ